MREVARRSRHLLNVIVLSRGQTDDLTTSAAALGYFAGLDDEGMAAAVGDLVDAGLLTVEPRPPPKRVRPCGHPDEFWEGPHFLHRPTHVRHVLTARGLLAVPDLDCVENLAGDALYNAIGGFDTVHAVAVEIGDRPRRQDIPAVDSNTSMPWGRYALLPASPPCAVQRRSRR